MRSTAVCELGWSDISSKLIKYMHMVANYCDEIMNMMSPCDEAVTSFIFEDKVPTTLQARAIN